MLDLPVTRVLDAARALFEATQPLYGPVRKGRPKAS
jgi:hypothetical protein